MADMAYRRATIRRCGRAAMLMLVPLLLGSCAAQASPAPAATAGAAQLRITQVKVGLAMPIEGAITFIRIERASGGTVTERRLPFSGKLTLALRPGAYRLVTWQRTCDANCGHLDPASSQCARPFTLRQGEPLHATIRTDFVSRCAIVLQH